MNDIISDAHGIEILRGSIFYVQNDYYRFIPDDTGEERGDQPEMEGCSR
jgi:hypothetical protein